MIVKYLSSRSNEAKRSHYQKYLKCSSIAFINTAGIGLIFVNLLRDYIQIYKSYPLLRIPMLLS